MTDQKTLLKGWIQAIAAIVIFLGINQVFARYCAVVLDVNPVVFSCTAFSSCAFVLLLIGGVGPLAKETMRSIDTWLFGIILMMSYIVGVILLAHVTSTESTMLQKISVFLSLIGSWFFLNRKPDFYQVIGTTIITSGVIIVCIGIPSDQRGIVYFLGFLYALFQVLRIFTAELHRPHAKAANMQKDPKARARVIGFIMFIISIVFLVFTFFIALAFEGETNHTIRNLPHLTDFLHAPTIFSGMTTGVFLVAPLRLLEFSSSNIIKGENFTTVTTFSFVATLFWEWATAPLTGLSIKEISSSDILAGLMITAGGLFIALTRHKRQNKETWKTYLKYEPNDLNIVDDSREIVANTLEHFNSDINRTAEALKLPSSVIEALMQDNEKVLAFKGKILQDVTRRYRRNVAMNDPLTGLINRTGFMSELKIAPTKSSNFYVLFIDLDKFKPVNDTHGHDAGDFVLVEVANRLKELFPNNTSITRLGGDEYCLLILDKEKDQLNETIEHIKQILTTPFIYNEHTITIGGSVGVAHYPTDTKTPEDLLKLADKGMYKEKKER